MKAIKEIKFELHLGKKVYHLRATQYKGKRRTRDYNGKIVWAECISTSGHCDAYPNCEWFPSTYDGQKTASFSCDGWEPEQKDFEKIDAVVTAMIRELKGWATENEVETEIANAEGK